MTTNTATTKVARTPKGKAADNNEPKVNKNFTIDDDSIIDDSNFDA